MLRNGLSLFAIAFVVSAVGWSEEPVRPKIVENPQRVSPKLLREVLELPEYQAKPSELKPPALTLGDLQKLADRLKKSDDTKGADLLERFIFEHITQPTQISLDPTASGSAHDIRVQVIEVNFDDLAEDSILRKSDLALANNADTEEPLQYFKQQKTKRIAELHRLVKEQKAKLIVDHALLQTKFNESVRSFDGGEFPVPVPGSNGTTTVEFREFGLIVEAMAIPVDQERIRLQLTCEVSAVDSQNSITVSGVTVPGVTKRRLQSTIDMAPNEWFEMAGLISTVANKTVQTFFMAKVTSSK